MKTELIVFGITGFLIYNTYYEGKFIEKLKSYEKYYKMATIGFVGLSLYLFLKKKPAHSKDMVKYANNFIKYMPIDRTTASMITPIVDFTMNGVHGNETLHPTQQSSINRIMTSGGGNGNTNKIKRCVSEPKKKFVAARQQWKCDHCKNILDATYEIDHIIELQHGGTNKVDNLVALCRNCHGSKTLQSHL